MTEVIPWAAGQGLWLLRGQVPGVERLDTPSLNLQPHRIPGPHVQVWMQPVCHFFISQSQPISCTLPPRSPLSCGLGHLALLIAGCACLGVPICTLGVGPHADFWGSGGLQFYGPACWRHSPIPAMLVLALGWAPSQVAGAFWGQCVNPRCLLA